MSRPSSSARAANRAAAASSSPCAVDRLGTDRQAAWSERAISSRSAASDGQAVGLLGRRAERSLELVAAAWMAQRELELGAQERERRPELVARIGHEAALVLERRLEPLEHVVQRLGEPRDLVPGRWHGEPAARASRRRSAPARRRIASTGRKAAPASTYPASAASTSASGPADEQLPPQALERLLADVERARQHERELLVRAADRDREQAPASAPPGHVDRRAHRGPEKTVRSSAALSSGARPGGGDSATPPPRASTCARSRPRVAGSRVERRLASPQPQRRLGRLREQRLVDRVEEIRADPQVDEPAQRREHERHCRRERQRQPDADRKAAQSSRRR